jgi:hypothetical protein
MTKEERTTTYEAKYEGIYAKARADMAALDARDDRARDLAPELVEALREYEALMETGFADRHNVERVRNIGRTLLTKIDGEQA